MSREQDDLRARIADYAARFRPNADPDSPEWQQWRDDVRAFQAANPSALPPELVALSQAATRFADAYDEMWESSDEDGIVETETVIAANEALARLRSLIAEVEGTLNGPE